MQWTRCKSCIRHDMAPQLLPHRLWQGMKMLHLESAILCRGSDPPSNHFWALNDPYVSATLQPHLPLSITPTNSATQFLNITGLNEVGVVYSAVLAETIAGIKIKIPRQGARPKYPNFDNSREATLSTDPLSYSTRFLLVKCTLCEFSANWAQK